MGTTWHVTLVPAGAMPDRAVLQAGIEAELERVNQSMSTYRQDSEISRFNALAPDTWFAVSDDFHAVLSTAMAVGWLSEGAYDVTVAPLVDLWGFGPAGRVSTPPPDELVRDVLQSVGQDYLRLDEEDGHRLLKTRPVSLDFSSIAKGYAVDLVARWLDAQGLDRYLVEVGGEMRLSGMSGRGDPWRVAIERPESALRTAEQAISLTDVAIATSGDYRNYFEVDGQRFSHSIDPRRGYPVAHDLVSVTVLDNSAMRADAWATALVVLGHERAMAVATEQGLAVYFIQRQGDVLHSSYSPAFAPFLENGDNER
jgi:thiamine biosynthesis lipoprotein